MATAEKFMADEAYADPRHHSSDPSKDPVKLVVDLWHNHACIREQASEAELVDLVQELRHVRKGAPLDDKKGTTELLIGILTSLPSTSEARAVLTSRLIDKLWAGLQHPPQTYVGGRAAFRAVDAPEPVAATDADEAVEFRVPDTDVLLRGPLPDEGLFQYRTPDGRGNNVLQPDVGKAGSPYARTVRATKRLHGVKPDPGILFDLLMARDDAHFSENPAGLSSMFFYHASIIIHDIFRSGGPDGNRSMTSSYLDLAPLYGSSMRDQLEIRTMKHGKLKPDTFHEKRLLGQPAGVSVLLVLYSRFHNHVCDVLLQINEDGRFTPACTPESSPQDRAVALAKQDHDLFNTARLIVGGLYVNISVHDYLRAITNTHRSASDWTLDPRVDTVAADGTPHAVGNQVSVEFNLLYRFHACISKKDERWMNDFFFKLFPGRDPDHLQAVSPSELHQALVRLLEKAPKDPSARDIGDIKRQGDGTFRNEDLVRVLGEAMDDPAGSFGARMIPKALRAVEILGINQARRWQVASLNEFRDFFGLKRHESFSDINSDPNIAAMLEKLYSDPDMVELYPGLMIEDVKPPRSTGCGICPTYSVGRAILTDAIALVRGDRFNTVDFTAGNLTNWGFREVMPDYETLGGSVLYRLIQRTLPGWFPYNSVAVMQPMYTKAANEEIARKLGTIGQFTMDGARQPPAAVVVSTRAAIKEVLGRSDRFAVPWLRAFHAMFPDGEKDLSWFMLAGDEARNRQNRVELTTVLDGLPDVRGALLGMIAREGARLIDKQKLGLPSGVDQLDIIRDVAIPLSAQMLADLFYLDLRSDDNPSGTLNATELYRHLLNIRIWGVENSDPAQAWDRRRRARESVHVIIKSTRRLVDEVAGASLAAMLSGLLSGRAHGARGGSLRACGHQLVTELLGMYDSPERVVDILWLAAFGGTGVAVTTFYEVMEYLLRPQNAPVWARVRDVARNGDDDALIGCVLEAQRLSSSQRNVRVATQKTEIEGKAVQPGDLVLMLLVGLTQFSPTTASRMLSWSKGEAGRNPNEVPEPGTFDPQREEGDAMCYSYGQHECLMKQLAPAYVAGMVRLAAGLEELRPAAGVRRVRVGGQMMFVNDCWSRLGSNVSNWDVVIIGGGLAGINFAYRLREAHPQLSFCILEARHEVGGTWSLFKYPGVRSDVDMYQYGFAWHVWRHDSPIGSGAQILDYIKEAAVGFDDRIRLNHRVEQMRWSTARRTWTLDVTVCPPSSSSSSSSSSSFTMTTRFVLLSTGHFDYEQPLAADIPGLDSFVGPVIHPQFWPDDFDYAGKRVVVIGSGVTAVNLVTTMAAQAKHVTMLQRSPSYIYPFWSRGVFHGVIHRCLSPVAASAQLRFQSLFYFTLGFAWCTFAPFAFRLYYFFLLRAYYVKAGPDIDHDFRPRYQPWEERIIVAPDGDFYRILGDGSASITTGVIAAVTPRAIRLTDGSKLSADVIVTATGMRLRFAGGIRISVDGVAFDPTSRFTWKAAMVEDLPNVVFPWGYAYKSFMLGYDVAARLACRLLGQMRREGHCMIVARCPDDVKASMDVLPLLRLKSTYVRLGQSSLPKGGDRPPWTPRSWYWKDLVSSVWGDVRTGLERC
ncbi:hypothetical protein L249_5918 [Ophiocordyceps polyrhachis-furcata BCC 54312]|uniref:FAD/NAD(P)-binding domain-containing protein n=1 Tax=Ophiocordyceps polyrhachis-furcata BCC 54312 TaxID=1330021 RepID=A0A367LJ71_9HYPO|nr:hypothetical protein L249_5918 [Ophiocordyceps polyrhachis-furcata BCC 54312]